MITSNLTGNLGNHMWQYSVCRTVAEKLGYEWGINPSPTHDYFGGMNQMYFMEIDFGKKVEGDFIDFHEKWTTHKYNGDIFNITMMDNSVWDIKDNTRLIGHNGAFGGIYQTEKYFGENSQTVKTWFQIKKEYELEYENKLNELGIILDENLCVINFRGGEYRSIPKVVCRKEYWRDSINEMIKYNPNMKFLVITDDIEFSKKYMPFDIRAIHVDIGFDFYVVNKAKWLIISNSTFGWWAAWLNECARKIIAPKYFGAHNLSNGFWSVGEIYTKKFYYMDREGVLCDYNYCEKEANNFYLTNNITPNESI